MSVGSGLQSTKQFLLGFKWGRQLSWATKIHIEKSYTARAKVGLLELDQPKSGLTPIPFSSPLGKVGPYLAPRLSQTLALGWERKAPCRAGIPGMNQPALRGPVVSQVHLSPKTRVSGNGADPGGTPGFRHRSEGGNSPQLFCLLPARLPAVKACPCKPAYSKPTLGLMYVEGERTAMKRGDSGRCLRRPNTAQF